MMKLGIVKETLSVLRREALQMGDKEPEFIVEFAFQTQDKEQTKQLVSELAKAKDSDEIEWIKERYRAMYEEKPEWLRQIENQLVALEVYRLVEEQAVDRLEELLKTYGIDVSVEAIRNADTEEIKKIVQRETAR